MSMPLPELSDTDLPPSGKLILKHFEGGGEWTQAELIEQTGLSRETVYAHLGELEERGYIERRRCWSDSRSSLFTLTENYA